MLEQWKQLLDNGYNVGILFMNLSKAFDVYSLVLAKLDAYGFSLKSVQSYLNKRMQKVNVNNKFSAWEDIFSFLTTCDMCNYADFHQVQEYLKKNFEILENSFYDNYMSLIFVNLNSWSLEKQMKMMYLPIMKSDLKKLLLRICLVLQ